MTSGRSVVVGVAGGSGSGKSTVVRRIVEEIGPSYAVVLRHDWYYRDLAHLTPAARAGVNYDHPDALETDLLAAHLETLLRGQPVEAPIYDFTEHVRRDQTVRIEPAAVVILDGILILADPRLRALMDVKVFVDADAAVRLDRRVRRDTKERGRSPESVRAQYAATVRPMHLEFVEPSKDHADVVVTGGGHNRSGVEQVVAAVRRALARAAGSH
jgi:uridine kinase